MRIEEFIDASNNATTVDELFGHFRTAMAGIGFDRLLLSLMNDHSFINRQAVHGILLNYPDEWMQYYTEKRYETADPVRHHLCSANGAFVWDDLSKSMNLTKRQSDILNEGAEAGLRNGIAIPLRGPLGALAGLGAASSSGGVDLHKNVLSYASLLSQQFYSCFLALEEKPKETPEIWLSDREQEILTWSARGKTKPEIAQILGISAHTVKFHLQKAYTKLDTRNDRFAVLKALYMGLIQL